MRRQHLDIAIEHYAYWLRIGLSHREMLAAIGIGVEGTAGDVVCYLAASSAWLEQERKLRERDAA